jgi:hypothetical protein
MANARMYRELRSSSAYVTSMAVTAKRPKSVSPSIHRSLWETVGFFTIPKALKAMGSNIGQDAAAAVKRVANTMTARFAPTLAK